MQCLMKFLSNRKKFEFQISNFFLLLFLQDGSRGHLDGLASVYCELLMAPFGEVLSALEDARQRAWLERSPKHSAGMNRGHRGNSSQTGTLPNSHSQPIYVPGKYSVSFIFRSLINHLIANEFFL